MWLQVDLCGTDGRLRQYFQPLCARGARVLAVTCAVHTDHVPAGTGTHTLHGFPSITRSPCHLPVPPSTFSVALGVTHTLDHSRPCTV